MVDSGMKVVKLDPPLTTTRGYPAEAAVVIGLVMVKVDWMEGGAEIATVIEVD